jgi:hypothetical protein
MRFATSTAVSVLSVLVYSATTPVSGECLSDKLTGSDVDPGGAFGDGVCIHRNTLVIGAEFNSPEGISSGSAFVFERHGGTWIEIIELVPSDGGGGDRFGHTVAIYHDTIAVGAPGHGFGGAVYIFERHMGGTNVWGQAAKIEGGGGDFPHTVSMSGRTLVATAPGAAMGGAAYVYELNCGAWLLQGALTASDAAPGDQLGWGSIDGSTVVVGAAGDDSFAGAAYVYERPSSGWMDMTETVKLMASDGAAGDYFGSRVGVSGGTILVTAPHDDSLAGAAYIFDRDEGGPGNWGEVVKLVADDMEAGDTFGNGGSIGGHTVVVGAHNDNPGGSAYRFHRNQGGANNWGQLAKLKACDAEFNDLLGQSVFVSCGVAVIGARQDDGTGSVFVTDFVDCPTDADGDDDTDVVDFLLLLGGWGSCP